MKYLRETFVLSALGLSLSFTAIAGPFEDGLGAYNNREYEKAATKWRTAARGGNAEAQFNLGYMYLNGQGLNISQSQAIFWYKKAAELGHKDAKAALERLGTEGVERKRSVDNMDGEQQEKVQVAALTPEFLPVETNVDLEIPLVEKPVIEEPPVEISSVETDVLPETPPVEIAIREVSQSEFAKTLPEVFLPIKKAQMDRIVKPPKNLSVLPLPNPDFDDGSEQFEQGIDAYNAGKYGTAFIFFRKAATKNHAKAQDYLGHLYFTGKGVDKSYNQALNWYHRAAKQGNIPSQKQLALIYSTGRYGVKKSAKEAAYWYEQAAELGDVPAMYHIGIAYYEGNGVKKSKSRAVDWLKQAADVGYEPAEIRLRFIALE